MAAVTCRQSDVTVTPCIGLLISTRPSAINYGTQSDMFNSSASCRSSRQKLIRPCVQVAAGQCWYSLRWARRKVCLKKRFGSTCFAVDLMLNRHYNLATMHKISHTHTHTHTHENNKNSIDNLHPTKHGGVCFQLQSYTTQLID